MDPKDLPNDLKRLLVERMADYILDHEDENENLGTEHARSRAYMRLFECWYSEAETWVLDNYEEHGSGKAKSENHPD